MARPYKGEIINEGYTDLGDFDIDITDVEIKLDLPKDIVPSDVPKPSLSLLFKLSFSSGDTVPSDLNAVFEVSNISGETFEYTLNPGTEGFLQLETPLLPIALRREAALHFPIDISVPGDINSRADECYLKLIHTEEPEPETYYYTLIYDLRVDDSNFLSYYDRTTDTYYKVAGNIEIGTDKEAVYITPKGSVYTHTGTDWVFAGDLQFTKIEFPAELNSISDGLYQSTVACGTLTDGILGETGTPFESFYATLNNSEPYYVNVGLKIYAPGSITPIHTGSWQNLEQGSKNYKPVVISGSAPAGADLWPTLGELAAVCGSFTPLMTFLGGSSVRMDAVKEKGPIYYRDGYSLGPDNPDVVKVQAHIDLYTINQNLNANQHLIDGGYDNLYKIAITEKGKFLNDTVTGIFPLFKAAQFHEVVVQNIKYVSSTLAATLTDYKLEVSPTPVVKDNTYAEDVLSKTVSSCDCSDCASGISPFAYLLELLKYSSEHIDYRTAPLPAGPVYNHKTPNYIAFINKITEVFLQPFGTLNVDCETLHDQYCRVRLVTEILEKKVAESTVVAPKDTILANARKEFLLRTYMDLLTQAGTSYTELRDIVAIPDTVEKEAAARKFSEKLGITLRTLPSPPSTALTVDRMWLTFASTGGPSQELTAMNLEIIFGFRDTDPASFSLLPTPESLMEKWRSAYLRETWTKRDYKYTNYSREEVDPANISTIKSNWLPIIDPDIIGWTDFTYKSSNFAIELWKHRKFDTDRFLHYYVNDATDILTRTSADINKRILKVVDRDIVNHKLEDDKISIADTASTRIDYHVLNKSLIGSDTDIILKKTPTTNPPTVPVEPDMVQPYGTNPTAFYRRIVVVPAGQTISATTFTITWPEPVIKDSLGYAKLISSGDSQVFATDASSPDNMTVSFVNDVSVDLVLGSAPNSAFCAGNVSFIYEVEVPLFTTQIPDPEKSVSELFTRLEDYNYLPPGVSATPSLPDPLQYYVWAAVTWPGGFSGTSYEKLKQLNDGIINGTATDDYYAIIKDRLQMTTSAFNRMMELMLICENYLDSSFTALRPTTEELYELASIYRSCGKKVLRKNWVYEEIKWSATLGGTPIMLMLSGQYFWKALQEPAIGAWDPSLQTIPAAGDPILAWHRPIIDPETLPESHLLSNPEAADYRALYYSRKAALNTRRDTYRALIIPYSQQGFVKILNDINTGGYGTSPFPAIYNITPYTTLDQLLIDLRGDDQINKKKAADVAWNAFGIGSEDFLKLSEIMELYGTNDPLQLPVSAELDKAIAILVTGYKTKVLYPMLPSTASGWISEEQAGIPSTPVAVPVYYYNIMKMRMPVGRSDGSDRMEWQRTLEGWNRSPFINPDIVPPENLIEFEAGDLTYDIWVARKAALQTTYTSLENLIKGSPLTAGQLFTNYKDQLDLIMARVNTLTPIAGNPYLSYFTEIEQRSEQGEDIRPLLAQYGILIKEYRYLAKIYRVLENSNPSGASPLLESEYKDIIDIIIHIRSKNLTFMQVLEEYNDGILLSQDCFEIYKPKTVNFTLTTGSKYNDWRAPYSERKAWLEVLQSRIEREKGIKDTWKTILLDVEEVTMPYLRDALISAITQTCETFDHAAERLGKTLLIETKDNCCVKHTRVSHCIETIQGLLFSLQNGIYDEYISSFELFAPHFKKEWEWIGSYSTWRSATFVYLYPENLLYPTLKRLKSHEFNEVAESIAQANRFSPEAACKKAKEFESYFIDVQNLRPVCSTNTFAWLPKTNLNLCCDSVTTEKKYMTFFFAQSKVSGSSYWSSKQYWDNSPDAHTFWQKLPINKEAKLLGCFALQGQYAGKTSNDLWCFYSIYDGGKLSLGYLQLNLENQKASWEEKKVEAVPLLKFKYSVSNSGSGVENFDLELEPKFITACQHSNDWENPAFIMSYEVSSGSPENTSYHHVACTLAKVSAKFEEEEFLIMRDPESLISAQENGFFTPSVTCFSNRSQQPITAVRHIIRKSSNQHKKYGGITVAFEDEVSTAIMDAYLERSLQGISKHKIFSLYQEKTNPNMIVYLEQKINNNKFGYSRTLSWNHGTGPYIIVTDITYPVNYPINLTDSLLGAVTEIYPVYTCSEGAERFYAIKTYASDALVGCETQLNINLPRSLKSSNAFGLAPEKKTTVAIESADCSLDMKIRKKDIEAHMKANMNAPLGTPSGNFLRTTVCIEYLYEAYYYLPMLLALDQQQRGQFEAALSWYRSFYDYTQTKVAAYQKIFYGLVLEENVGMVYQHSADWLLDPLNPHLIARKRANAYTKYTLMNIVQCLNAYGDREFTLDTIETVPNARKLYTSALELLGKNELNVKANGCVTIPKACLSGITELDSESEYSDLNARMIGSLQSFGDINAVNAAVDEIVAWNTANPGSSGVAFFTEAFNIIKTNRPVESSKTVNTLIGEMGEHANNAYRYVSVYNKTDVFAAAVADDYAIAVSELCKIPLDTVNNPASEGKMGWLNNALPDNNAPYIFNFAASDGEQFFKDDSAYNPLAPRNGTYQPNFAYSNPNIFIAYQTPNQISYTYSPFIAGNFCIPGNPVYDSLRLKSNLELFKIYNCRNIAGMVREIEVYAAPTDSTTGIPVIGAGGNLVLPGAGSFTPSQYRFKVLIERAKQLVQQSQQIESLFLAAMEKEDAENYSQLKAKQDLQTAKATIKLQDLRIKQASSEKTLAEAQLEKYHFTKEYYSQLMMSGKNYYEQENINYMIAALISQGISVTGYTADLMNITGQSVAMAAGAIASGFSMMASLQGIMASFARREQEWKFQEDQSLLDINIGKQQVRIAEDNIRIVTQEKTIAQLNMDHANDSFEFLKNKFTNAALYSWMGNILERSYSYMLSLSTAIARTAERQLYFERQEQAGPFILDDYWEAPSSGFTSGSTTERRGLTGSARLLTDITRLDQYAFDRHKRKLQMNKVISLGQNFPSEFQIFRETGVLNFALTNKMFDYDFPGHYLRLINSVKTTVVGLLPVYDGIKATLTADTVSYTVIGGTIFQKTPIKRMELDSVALTSPTNATGLFELQPMQEGLLNPFEGMGIESRWEFKMPQFSNHIDYGNIADVLINVEYTALDSYQYKYQVLQELDNTLIFNKGFSLKNDFPDQWYELGEAQANSGSGSFGVTFEFKKEFFPQGLLDLKLYTASDIVLYFEREDGFEDEIEVLDFSKVSVPPNPNLSGNTTNGGKYPTGALMNSLGDSASPVLKLRLLFANTFENRKLFSEGNIKDILIILPCKGELKNYPL